MGLAIDAGCCSVTMFPKALPKHTNRDPKLCWAPRTKKSSTHIVEQHKLGLLGFIAQLIVHGLSNNGLITIQLYILMVFIAKVKVKL